MKSAWEIAKTAIKAKIPAHIFRMWIEPIRFKNGTPDNFELFFPNHFSKKWVLDHYGHMIQSEIDQVVKAPCQLSMNVSMDKTSRPSSVECQIPLPHMNVRPHNGRFLREDFTFDKFVVGDSNGFAYSASLALASQNSRKPNALFLLSKTGLGKSHLSQAIGHHILSARPGERVYYMTAEEFTSELIQGFKTNSLGAFKDKYRNQCDVLLLEDVHYLSGKVQTQIELALTLDTLFDTNKQIIFSSCYLPSEIPKLNDKLRSRLGGGLISTIEAPDFKTRVKILKKLNKLNGALVSQEVVEYLASELTENVRQLKNGLESVSTKATLLGVPIDTNLARSVAKNIVKHQKTVTIDVIKKLVCKHYGISVKDIVSRSRKQTIVRPRQIAMYLTRRYTAQPLQFIGRSFNRYHATALHSIGAIEKELKRNGLVRKQIEFLIDKLDTGDY